MATKIKIRPINIINNYLKNNIKEYMITSLIFLIGIFLGVMFINNSDESQNSEIKGYIENYIQINKENNIDSRSIIEFEYKR